MSGKYLKYIPRHYKKILLIIELFRLLGQAFQKMLLPQRVRAF